MKTSFKSVFLFSNIKFFSDAIKLSFAKENIETHIFEEFDTMEYFIQDLSPDVFIIEIEGFKEYEKMMRELKSLSSIPIILVGNAPLKVDAIFIQKPIIPQKFKDLIDSKLSLSH